MSRILLVMAVTASLALSGPAHARLGAVPGPPILAGHMVASRGCTLQSGSITAAVGETVYFGVEGCEDVDYYYDPTMVIDGCHLEQWVYDGAGHTGTQQAVWYQPGSYTVTAHVADDAMWADDAEHPEISIQVNVVQEVEITKVYSWDGVNEGGGTAGTICMDVAYTSVSLPEVTATESQSIHEPVTLGWQFLCDKSESCAYPHKAAYIWRTPFHAPENYHNAPWEIKARVEYCPPGSAPVVTEDERSLDLKNLLIENVSPEILKHDPENGGGCVRTIHGSTSDDYTLNPLVTRTEIEIEIRSATGACDVYGGTLVHHAFLEQTQPGGFSYEWDGTVNILPGSPQAQKGLYAAAVYADQGHPGSPYEYHYDGDAYRSGDLGLGPVWLVLGDYDRETHSRPFSLQYLLTSFSCMPPEYVNVDLYDPDLGLYRTWSGGTSLTETNEITGDLPLHEDGKWGFVVSALDQGQAHDKAHRQRPTMPTGTTYTRQKPVVRLVDPDPEKSPHNNVHVAVLPPGHIDGGNEYTYGETVGSDWAGHTYVLGLLNIPATTALLKADDPSEAAAETEWSVVAALPNQLPRYYPSFTDGLILQPQSQGPGWEDVVRGLESRQLPEDNDEFGDYALFLTANGHSTAEGGASAEFQVFYQSDGAAHPASGQAAFACPTCVIHGTGTVTPNWFYYRWQTLPESATWTIDYTDMSDVAIPVSSAQVYFSIWAQSTLPVLCNHVHVGQDGRDTAVTFPVELASSPTPSDPTRTLWAYAAEGTCEVGRYIDAFYRCVAHEFCHKWVRDSLGSQTDTDGDGLPDTWENAHHFDPNNSYTLGVVPSDWAPGNLLRDDQEVLCMMAEHGRLGPGDADWGSPGWNVGEDAPTDVFSRLYTEDHAAE